ncbi:MAG: PDZ domain-containing protein [Gemmatimonadales bacterium]
MKKRISIVGALAVCTLLPAALAAQEPAPRARSRPRVQVERGPWGVFSFSDSRGRIGVLVDTKADEARDRIGARIEGVTPGGPAEKAGLKANDVITRFNGTALGGAEAENDEESGPGMKLIELARALEPGDTVQVDYRRGNDNRKATIVAEDIGWSRQMEIPEGHVPGALRGMLERSRGMLEPGEGNFFVWGSPWNGIELVKLNPDLGDYFGTREGVLVVRAPEDSTLALKGGDVIIAIGRRKPTSPMQAMRILRSYDAGETVTLDVLRKQKRVAVTWKVPDAEDRFRRLMPRMREEPSWFRLAPKLRSLQVWKVRDMIRASRVI